MADLETRLASANLLIDSYEHQLGIPTDSTDKTIGSEIQRLLEVQRAAAVFYKRVSARVPGLLEQIEDVAKPLRVAIGMEDAT